MKIQNPDLHDCNIITDLLYQSGPKVYDYLFTTKSKYSKDYIQHEYQTGKGICGYKNVLCFYDDNKIVGTCLFFNKKGYKKISLETLSNILSFYSFFDIIRILFRVLRLETIMKSPRKNEIYLSNFSVNTDVRGKGFGSELLRTVIRKYSDEGYKILGLDVETDNSRAKKLYNRIGFIDKKKKILSIDKKKYIEIIKMEIRL